MRLARIFKRLAVHLSVAILFFALGGIVFYAYRVRSGPPLEPWHTVELPGEFSAENAASFRSLDDYRRMEDGLFAQLDQQIYSRTETGPGFALVRYSSGSTSDPQGWNPNWNRSFELPAKPPRGGVLLLHGMSDSPYSLRAIGTALNRNGYWVVGLRLPGHGTAPSGLKTVRWEDMVAAARLGMVHLAAKAGQGSIHMIGYSTGAALALQYTLEAQEATADPVPASLVLISPAIAITPAAALAEWKGRLAGLPGLEKFAWASILPEFDPYKYNSFAVNGAEQVHRLTRTVARGIEARAGTGLIQDFPPTLALLSTVDATVSTDAVIDNLLEHLAPHRHELLLFDINRRNVIQPMLISDPGPLTSRLLADESLPFSLTLLTNENTEGERLVIIRKRPYSSETSTEPLSLTWPRGVISLSHVALPFPPDDPMYGRKPARAPNTIFLGQMPIQGERELLLFPSNWLLRLRHNPFYDVLERRTLEWVDSASDG